MLDLILSRSCIAACCRQALLGTESPAKRTRLSAKGSPIKDGAALDARRAIQVDDLDRDVKQVMNYADEKVIQHHDSMVGGKVFEGCLQLPRLYSRLKDDCDAFKKLVTH